MTRLVVATLLLGACASSAKQPAPPPTAAPEQATVEQLYVELRNHDIEFRNLLLEENPFGACKRMRELQGLICGLAERICRIAEKEPPGSQAAAFCSEGKARCKNAVERVAGRGCDLRTDR